MLRRIIFGITLTLFLVGMKPTLALVVGTITDLGIPVPDRSNVWTLTTGSDGRIFGGTSNGTTSHIFFYNPLTEAFTDLGGPGVEVYTLTTGNDGLIYGGSYMAPEHNAHFFVYDPEKAWNPGTSPENNPYDMGPWNRVAGVPDAEVPGWAIIFDLTTGLDGKIYGGSGYGLDTGHYDYTYIFEYDPSTKTIQSIYHATVPSFIHRLTTGLDGKVYFAVSSTGYSHLFVYDPLGGLVTDLGEPVAPPDNIAAITTGADGKIYIGTGMSHLVIYELGVGFTDLGSIPISQVIWTMTTDLYGIIYGGDGLGNFFVYSPSEFWNPGITPGSNPYNMGQAVAGETRIRSLTTGIDGKIYGGTAWHAHLFVYAPPLSASISPLSASLLVGQSVTFTSTVSGGYTPYSYQWYLNGNPVSGANASTWTFTPTTSGIYYVYLKVTDAKGNTAQSETARITVATVPVGGYSIPIERYTTASPLTPYLALIAILMVSFIVVRRKGSRKTK